MYVCLVQKWVKLWMWRHMCSFERTHKDGVVDVQSTAMCQRADESLISMYQYFIFLFCFFFFSDSVLVRVFRFCSAFARVFFASAALFFSHDVFAHFDEWSRWEDIGASDPTRRTSWTNWADRLAKASTSVFNANISVFVSEVSCSLSYSLSIKSVTNLFNPCESLTHE